MTRGSAARLRYVLCCALRFVKHVLRPEGEQMPPLNGRATCASALRSANSLWLGLHPEEEEFNRFYRVELTGVEPVSKQGILVLSTRLSWP